MTKKGQSKAKAVHKAPRPVSSSGEKKKKKKAKVASVGGFTKGSGNVGSQIGSKLGSLLGGVANKAFDYVTGHGAYSVKNNSLSSGRPPMFQSRSGADGSIEFMHSEFLQDIVGSVAFTNTNFNVNVGLVRTFPFLSHLAANFEQYELLGMIYEYRSTSATSVGTANTALGVVVMSTDYDVLDENFSSKQQMEAYMFTTSCAPSETMLHPIECAKRSLVLDNLYIRTGDIPTMADQRFYDVGNFQIATVGMQVAATIGELWCTYHVRLLKPKLQTPLGGNLQGTHLIEQPLGTASAVAVFGSAPDSTNRIKAGSTLNIVENYGGNAIAVGHVGRYVMLLYYRSNQVITAVPSVTLGANLVPFNFFDGASVSFFNLFEGAGVTRKAVSVVVFNCITYGEGAANTITITGPAGMLTGSFDMVIQQVSSGLTESRFGNDSTRGNFLDGILDRLARLEAPDPMVKPRTVSQDDDDWVGEQLSSSSSPLKKQANQPNMDKTFREAGLTESVADLLTSKLRLK